MTEKRFTMIKSEISGLYVPIDEQKHYNFSGFEDEHDCIRIVTILNKLYDMQVMNGKIASNYLKENEQLKQSQASTLREFEKSTKRIQKLARENEQLKKKLSDLRIENYGNLDGINYYQEENGHLSGRISDLECENEQLKRLFDEADDLILSQCTTYHQRQWENIKKNIKGDVE